MDSNSEEGDSASFHTRKDRARKTVKLLGLLIDGNAKGEVCFGRSGREGLMQRLRIFCAAVLAVSLVGVPVCSAAPSVAPLGTVIAAERAHVGHGIADVGTTVYGGDFLSTETKGSVQVRAGAARLLLLDSSSAIVNESEGAPSAKLLAGTATFSTAHAHAFTLFASTAAIRPLTDAPTIGQVTYVSEKELLVTARRGGLAVSVDDETQTIAPGTSYRVLLDPDAQEPAGAGSGNQGPARGGGGPLKAGRSRFLIVATALIAAGTGVAIYKALESSDAP
jgi:hypothetical protein